MVDRELEFELRVWNVATGEVITPRAPGSFERVPAPQWSPAGDRIFWIVSPGQDASRALYAIDPSGIQDATLITTGLNPSPRSNVSLVLSPDGKRLAAVHPEEPGTITIRTLGDEEDLDPSRFSVGEAAEFRTVRWASDGNSLLVSVRRSGQEYYGIEEIDLEGGAVRTLAAYDADLSAPVYHPGGAVRFWANIDGLQRTRICTPEECRWLGPEGHGSTVAWVHPRVDTALVILTSPTKPPALHSVDLRTGISSPVYEPVHALRIPEPGGRRLDIRSRDGLHLPVYHWPAVRIAGQAPAAFIHVPGGPGLQATPLWASYIAYLTSRGIDVLYVNYRGQIGHGTALEHASGGIRSRADDVLAVRDYAMTVLGYDTDRIVLYGHSYGAPIVARAALKESLSGPLIFASFTRAELPDVEPAERCVIAFHGEIDRTALPASSRAEILRLFGRKALTEPCGHYRLLPRERHWTEASTSLAEVFSSAVTVLRRE